MGLGILHHFPKQPDYDLERDCLGNLKIQVLNVPLSDCKIIFMQPDGTPVLPGHAVGEVLKDPRVPPMQRSDAGVEPIRACGFQIEHPKIDPLLVKRIELRMDYEIADFAWVKIEMYIGTKIEPSEEGS